MKRTIAALFLIIVSVLCYYVPSNLVDLTQINISDIPKEFYRLYCYVCLFDFILLTFYAFYLFIMTDIKYWIAKSLFAMCFIGELFTVLNYTFSKFVLNTFCNNLEYYISLCIIGIIFVYFLRLVFTKEKSDEFDFNRTYLIKYKPKNYIGLLNYIFNQSGHFAVYQDGYKYSFKKNYIVKELLDNKKQKAMVESAILKLIPYNSKIEKLVGKKYSLFKYNCLNLRKDAIS